MLLTFKEALYLMHTIKKFSKSNHQNGPLSCYVFGDQNFVLEMFNGNDDH